MADLVFLDTETTGLNHRKHHVWEVAYAINDGPIECFQVHHTLQNADLVALKLNGYLDRVKQEYVFPDEFAFRGRPPSNEGDTIRLQDALRGNHIVGSNPDFDTRFLNKRFAWSEDFWHHRKIDVTNLAMPILNWDRPKGMADIIIRLNELGYDIAAPDHSAAGDVHVLRQVYKALTPDPYC